MLDTLYGKTFLILGSQLGITWLCTLFILGWVRHRHHAQAEWVIGGLNQHGSLDLEVDWGMIKPYFWTLLIADIAVFAVMFFFGQSNLYVGVPLFTLWSLLTGFTLALALISVDENLGTQVLGLMTLFTVAAGLAGIYSRIDFSFLNAGLFFSLLLIVAFGLIRILFAIPRWLQRLLALFSVLVFAAYLIFNFNRLSIMTASEATNTWPTAMQTSINIYVNVINLFFQLLDLLGK